MRAEVEIFGQVLEIAPSRNFSASARSGIPTYSRGPILRSNLPPPFLQKNSRPTLRVALVILAEAERFELSMPCDMPRFQRGALDHYATPPSREVIP